MKKLSHMIKKEDAFYLPLVLMISSIVLSALITSATIYYNELKMTEQLIQQTEAETIIQMAKQRFLTEKMYNDDEKGEIKYNFPSGEATINYEMIEQHKYSCTITVKTNKEVVLESFTYLMIQSK